MTMCMHFLLQIAVEGNIASGKTTLLNVFAEQYSAEVNNNAGFVNN